MWRNLQAGVSPADFPTPNKPIDQYDTWPEVGMCPRKAAIMYVYLIGLTSITYMAHYTRSEIGSVSYLKATWWEYANQPFIHYSFV